MADTATDIRVERKPKLSERVVAALRAQVLGGEIAPGQKLPTESQLTETFGVSRTVDPRSDRHAGRRRAGRAAPGRRRLRASSTSRRAFGAISLGDGQQGSRMALNVLEVRMGIEIESAGLAAHPPQRRAGSARSRRPSSSSSGCCTLGEPTGKADFAFHRAIAAATNNPFYVEMLDALGAPHHSLRRHLALVRPRACCPTNTSAGCSASIWSSSTPFRPAMPRPRATRCARISPPARSATASACSGQQAEYLCRASASRRRRCLTSATESSDHDRTTSTTRPASPSIPRPRPRWGPTNCATISTSATCSSRAASSLTYTHYDRMIVGGAMPVDGAAGAGGDQADRHEEFPRPPRADRRQHRRRRDASRPAAEPMSSAAAT